MGLRVYLGRGHYGEHLYELILNLGELVRKSCSKNIFTNDTLRTFTKAHLLAYCSAQMS